VEPGAFALICCTLEMALVVSYLLIYRGATWKGAMGHISPAGHRLITPGIVGEIA
jgi:hypothetical protein